MIGSVRDCRRGKSWRVAWERQSRLQLAYANFWLHEINAYFVVCEIGKRQHYSASFLLRYHVMFTDSTPIPGFLNVFLDIFDLITT